MNRTSSALSLILSFSVITLTSCSKDTILSTSTSVGLTADGDIQAVPDHLSAGFRRRELIYSGKNANHDGSVLAAIDSTTTWNRGSAIEQTSATGYAADIVANKNIAPYSQSPTEPAGTSQPLTFVSDTVFGLKAILIPENQGESNSVILGYKRKAVTRVRPDSTGRLASTYSNTSIHAAPAFGGTTNTVSNPLSTDHQLSQVKGADESEVNAGGVRIRQSFAIGKAAEKLLIKPKTTNPSEVTVGDQAAEKLTEE
ncbi:MAG: hypothetical protein ACSHYF_17235 [Verrucomicrobiaceae bacterium]